MDGKDRGLSELLRNGLGHFVLVGQGGQSVLPENANPVLILTCEAGRELRTQIRGTGVSDDNFEQFQPANDGPAVQRRQLCARGLKRNTVQRRHRRGGNLRTAAFGRLASDHLHLTKRAPFCSVPDICPRLADVGLSLRTGWGLFLRIRSNCHEAGYHSEKVAPHVSAGIIAWVLTPLLAFLRLPRWQRRTRSTRLLAQYHLRRAMLQAPYRRTHATIRKIRARCRCQSAQKQLPILPILRTTATDGECFCLVIRDQ